mmetsp:Transcript_37268/g.43503  ORF Transcript_37268/g.43503 Transcript_37268/m.43503 type:complete len:155 (+) Transcript_37268:38-502(+)
MEKEDTLQSSSLLMAESEPKIKNLELLLDGHKFLKYGKWGDPGYRIVRVSKDLSKLEWLHQNEKKPSGSIPVSKLIGIKFGRHTSIFKKNKAKSDVQEQLSFTVFGEERNLDLEADAKDQMDLFVEGLISLISYQRSKNLESVKGSGTPVTKVA